MTAAALPLILAAGGTALQLNAQREAAQERRRLLNRQMDETERATDRATELVQKEAQNFAPEERAKALAAQEQEALTRAQADLAGAGGNVIDTAGSAGNVSADFLKAQADRQISEGNRLTSVAREVAKTRAPGLLMTTEGQRRANLAGNLQNTFGTARNMANAAGIDAQNVQEPAYGQIAGLVGQVAGSYLAKGGGGVNWGGR